MNAKLLIDALTRQTTVLVAELATTAGIRAPLAHVADQVFRDLANAIEGQGVTRKVAADMFGLALRSYQLKVQRLEESLTERDRSLWEAVFEHIRDEGVVRRTDLLRHFACDDEASVKSIVHDLVRSGLVFQTGQGDSKSYRAATDAEIDKIVADETADSAPWLVWIAIYRSESITRTQLIELVGLDEDRLDAALDELMSEGRISADERDGDAVYHSDVCVIPMDESEAGWEAALFDHFNAVVTAMCAKLRQMQHKSLPADVIGGSTYSFDLAKNHPYRDEVLGLLRQTRRRVSELRQKVTAYNDEHGRGDEDSMKVTFYMGQSVIEPNDKEME